MAQRNALRALRSRSIEIGYQPDANYQLDGRTSKPR
jgi:hypothetical protein